MVESYIIVWTTLLAGMAIGVQLGAFFALFRGLPFMTSMARLLTLLVRPFVETMVLP